MVYTKDPKLQKILNPRSHSRSNILGEHMNMQKHIMQKQPFPNHKPRPLKSEDFLISHFPNIPTGNQHPLPRRVFWKRMHVGRDGVTVDTDT